MSTGIQWTDETLNPSTGCTRVTRHTPDGKVIPGGCDHCYAFQLHDLRHVAWKRGHFPGAPVQYHQPFSRMQLQPERLAKIKSWRKPRKVFVNSMSDFWHADIPDSHIALCLAAFVAAPQHIFQILTKRPERMMDYMWTHHPEPIPNVWLGVSVEDQRAADERIPILVETPAAVRFLSCEPLLGMLDLSPWLGLTYEEFDPAYNVYEGPGYRRHPGVAPELDWVIVGGESGRHHRPVRVEWVRDLSWQCQTAEVAFFFKQWGGHTPKAGGRLLDGRTWDEMPEAIA